MSDTSIAIHPITADKLIRLEQVMELTALCRSHVFSLIKKGQFPSSITIGIRSARWSNNEIQQWIAARKMSARTPAVPVKSSVGSQWSSSL
jgi:prophage regulatory protein